MNSNGFIKAKELNQVLKSIGQNPTQEEMKIIFREVSINETKDLNKMSIDFPEFFMALIRCMKKNVFNYLKNKEIYQNLFKNDILDVQKMVKELRECGINVTKDELVCLIDESHLNIEDYNDRHHFKFLGTYQ
jgi:Ca2+-binding EF-hand superfamily protein